MAANDTAHDAAAQVGWLRDRLGIAFDLFPEDAAADFLRNDTYLYKAKAYAANFESYQRTGREGMAIGVDFAHIVELSRIDKALRGTALSMALDIEHWLKVRVNRSAMDCGIDPRGLVGPFFEGMREGAEARQLRRLAGREREALSAIGSAASLLGQVGGGSTAEEMVASANSAVDALGAVTSGIAPSSARRAVAMVSAGSYSRGLADSVSDASPYWELLEVVSFATTLDFYGWCFGRRGPIPDEGERAVARRHRFDLERAKAMRNASAHSACLLAGLRDRGGQAGVRAVRSRYSDLFGGASPDVGGVSGCMVAMDFAHTLLAYDAFVHPGGTRRGMARELGSFARTASSRLGLFGKCKRVHEVLAFLAGSAAAFAGAWGS